MKNKLLTTILSIFFLVTLLIFNVANISALEFDNVKSYDAVTREVTIKNAFGLGADIGKARLNTPLNNKVGLGYQKVAEFDLWAYQDYNDILKSIDFYDKNKVDWEKNKFTREFDIKYKTSELVKIDDYKTECFIDTKSLNQTEICEQIKIGFHYEEKEKWEKINPADLKKNEFLTIGIFTNVEYGDYVEWIPQIYGVRVVEWATWTADLNTDLQSYWKFDETSGAVAIDSLNYANATINGATINQAGKIDKSYSYDGNDYLYTATGLNIQGANPRSVWAWVYPTSSSGLQAIYSSGVPIDNQWFLFMIKNGFLSLVGHGNDFTSTISVPNNQWSLVGVDYDGTTLRLHKINSTGLTTQTSARTYNTASHIQYIGVAYGDSSYFHGKIDEMGIWSRILSNDDIIQLYNSGDGITYTSSPKITLNSPADELQSASSNINFNATITPTNVNITNVTLNLNGDNYTDNYNTNEIIDYYKSLNLDDGNYVWNITACILTAGDEVICTTSDTRNLEIDSIAPQVEIINPINNTNYDTLILLNISATDDNLDSVWYNLNDGENITYTEPINITGLQGINYLNVYANDTLNNINSSSIIYYLEKLGVYLTSPLNDTIIYSNPVTFIANATILEGNLSNATLYYNDGSGWNTDSVDVSSSPIAYFYQSFNPGDIVEWNIEFCTTDGSSWNESYDSTGLEIWSLAEYNGKLYAGTGLNGKVLVYDGSTWSESYDSTEPYIRSLAEYNGKLYAGTGQNGKVLVFDSSCNFAEDNWIFIIDSTPPQVTASLNETILYSEGQEVGLEYNITDSNLDSCWYTYNDINTSINCSEISTTITTTLSALDVVVYANDSLGNLNQSETLSMILDPAIPEIVLSAGNETSGYYYSGVNHTINFTINDNNLDSIWWEYNSANTSISPAISGEAQSITFEVDSGIYTATIYANDSIGNSNQLIVNWNYGLTEDSITFNPATIEGSIEDYYLNVTLSGLSLISATFYYDGVAKVSQIEADGNERFIKVEYFEVPPVTTDEDKEFYWTLIFSDETAINSTFNNQSVNNIGVNSCGGSYTYKLIDLYLKDEETTDTINGYIEVDYSLFNPTTQTIVQNYSYLFEGVNNVPICSDINLSDSNFLFDAQIRYYATNYSSELYNIQMGSLETPINLSLYYLAIDDSTEFLVTYQDENAIKVDGAIIQLLRKYISEGIYRVVEAPETSADGTAILHIDLDSVIYDVIVIKDGVELDRFENVVFACDSAYSTLCTQKLYGTLDPGNSIPIETIDDFSYTLTTFNDSIKLTYSITSGTPSNINMILEQTDSFGSKINCNGSVVSSGGSIECGFNETIGDSVIKVLVLKDGEPMAIKSYVLEEDRRIEFLGNNYFIALIILLSVVAMAFSSPEWIVMNGVFTMLILGGLTLVRGLNFTIGLGSLMWLIVAGAILVMKISKQEDR